MGMKSGQQTTKAARAERQENAMALRVAGASYPDIARQLKCSVGTAWKDVDKAIKRAQEKTSDLAAKYVTLDVQRLDRATLAIWPMVQSGHLGAIDRLIHLNESRARLLGYGAPVRQEVSGFGGGPIEHRFIVESELDAEIARLLDELAAQGETGPGVCAEEEGPDPVDELLPSPAYGEASGVSSLPDD